VVIIFLVMCCGGRDSGHGEGVNCVSSRDDVGDDCVKTIGGREHRDGVVDLGGEAECAEQAEFLGQHRRKVDADLGVGQGADLHHGSGPARGAYGLGDRDADAGTFEHHVVGLVVDRVPADEDGFGGT
jgi:hypothetical protein